MIAALIRVSRVRNLLIALVALLAGGAALFQLGPYAELRRLTGGAALPEERPDFVGSELIGFLDGLGEPGRELYGDFQLLDLFNPLLIGAFALLLTGWLVRLAGREDSWARWLVLTPTVFMAADLGENLALLLALATHPSAALLGGLVSFLTKLKFFGLPLAILAIVVAVVLAALQGVRGTRRNARESTP